MTQDLTTAFAHWLEQGGSRIGQIVIERTDTAWELRNAADRGRKDLESYSQASDARMLANLDDAGAYRPLKTAPNLRSGWRLLLPDPDAVRRAIDYFYPAMLGVWRSQASGTLEPVDLRETLGRQTGMYRITQKIEDHQARRLIAKTCESGNGCLKTILWRLDANTAITALPPEKFAPPRDGSLPLFCHEACNLLIAAARKVVKGET